MDSFGRDNSGKVSRMSAHARHPWNGGPPARGFLSRQTRKRVCAEIMLRQRDEIMMPFHLSNHDLEGYCYEHECPNKDNHSHDNDSKEKSRHSSQHRHGSFVSLRGRLQTWRS